MLDQFKRFDMQKDPMRQKLRWLTYLLSKPKVRKRNTKIIYDDKIKNYKGPLLLLGNHNAFSDMEVLNVVAHKLKFRMNYIVAIDGFIKREKLLRIIGGICKRKFVSDKYLIKQLKKVVDRGDTAVIYPEARYSLCGTTAIIPKSLAKLVKFLNVPVGTLLCHGHHINTPFWNLDDRHIPYTEALCSLALTKEEVKELSVDQIHEKIVSNLTYNDYEWQRDNDVRLPYEKRAEGLEKVLYQCPCCSKEYEMASSGNNLYCKSCGKKWILNNNGTLSAEDGNTEFELPPDWYEWERENVKKEVSEGKYRFEDTVDVDFLPNAEGYKNLGKGHFIHDENGFYLKGNYEGEDYEIKISAKEAYSVHIEYDYLGCGRDLVDINTLNETMYLYPNKEKFAVTKISLATEEIYKKLWNK